MPPLALFAVLSLLVSGIVTAVTGRVLDARTGAPIIGAEIVIVGQPGSVRSDETGRFLWPVAPPMPIDVIVLLPDGRVARPIRLTVIDATKELTLTLDPIVAELVGVTGAAPTIDAAPGAATTLITAGDLQLRHPLTVSQALETVQHFLGRDRHAGKVHRSPPLQIGGQHARRMQKIACRQVG